MTTFALVHGGWHGADCWTALAPFLRARGHNVVAMDLPCDDASANFSDYADVVCDALEGCDEDVILVGHSMGGQTVPLVADRRPVEHLVYLCALVPEVGLSLGEQLVEEPSMLRAGWDSALSHPDEAGRTSWVDMPRTKELLYADCDSTTVAHAIGSLRPQASYPLGFPFPLREFPSIPATSVICREDRMLGNDWGQGRRAGQTLRADHRVTWRPLTVSVEARGAGERSARLPNHWQMTGGMRQTADEAARQLHELQVCPHRYPA